jgi:hypothetical protein
MVDIPCLYTTPTLSAYCYQHIEKRKWSPHPIMHPEVSGNIIATGYLTTLSASMSNTNGLILELGPCNKAYAAKEAVEVDM